MSEEREFIVEPSDHVFSRPPRPTDPRPAERLCPNCNNWFQLGERNKVYCSFRCHDQAKAVRYARACIAKYGPRVADWPTDIQVALRVKWAFGLGNGYDTTARKLSPQLRKAVLDRDNHRCVRCGATKNLVLDHIDGPDNAPDNLQTLCSPCHDAKTTEYIAPILEGTERAAEADWLHRRVTSPTPLRACDAHGWDYAAWKRDHSRTEPATG